ncbi:hypothetical protein GCM10018781_60240 [Kitasatospora indigofera]|uniref:Uncharacterized protein n=1 Tax=Kitasatospora indigofera TaxID=67307 RepID=A0A919L1A4_9ACTN|nr:hypothetical protein [Kitasatospora indigofera]GHH80307.1 hypothetical protein GCM10018781_60240 [Kitasatospora indigofera]
MYSYDVAAAHRQPTTVTSRPIPGMRPSYDAEHPHSTTPIYDELYSEYRRLFRALPGDRSGEEDLRFAGFAVRDPYPSRSETRSYPQQQQTFLTYAGQTLGAPQFMPGQQNGQHEQQNGTPGGSGAGQPGRQPEDRTDGQNGQPAGLRAGSQAGSHGGQLGNGQGWVAAGYLGPVQAAGAGVGGRHRNRLSLPPGRSSAES